MKSLKRALLSGWVLFILTLFVGAYGILDAETKDPNATIKTYEDALWWSVNVASAVGDCDICPKSLGGRAISVLLMIIGYALFAINISALTLYFKKEIRIYKYLSDESKEGRNGS